MNWQAIWSGVVGTAIPAVIVSLIRFWFNRSINRSIEKLKSDLQRDIVTFTKWHDKRIEACVIVYEAFAKYLDFLRSALYVPGLGNNMDPMHAFAKIFDMQALYLGQDLEYKIRIYQEELLIFWNESLKSIARNGEGGRAEIKHRLDYSIPQYLVKLRADINELLGPKSRAGESHPLRGSTNL